MRHFIKLREVVLAAGFALMATTLSSCTEDENSAPPPPPPGGGGSGGGGGGTGGSGGGTGGSGPPANPETLFGAGFQAAFVASASDAPRDPVASDIVAIDRTIDPVDIADPD